MKRIGRAAVVLAAMFGIAACDGDDAGESTVVTAETTAPTTTEPSAKAAASVLPTEAPATTQTVPPVSAISPVTYVIVAGDAVFSIATDHCTTGDAIVTANSWSDGVNHAIHAGDIISLPSESCSPSESVAETPSPATTESDLDQLFSDPIDRLGQIRNSVNPISGTNAGQFSDPECVLAYSAGFDFEMGVGSKADARAAVAALTDTIPSELTDYMNAWDKFINEYGDDVIRITTTYDNQGEDAALADPALDEVAFAIRDDVWPHGRRQVSEFVNGTCAPFQL